jgi:hypothetical protein
MSKKSRPSAAPSHPVPADTRTLPLHDSISRQAAKLWERYGRPQGRDDEIWLEAERQVLGADRQANEQAGGAIPAAPLGDVLYPTAQTSPRPEPEAAQERDNRANRGDGRMGAPGADTGVPK